MELLECIHQQFGMLRNPTLQELGEALGNIPNLSTFIDPYVKEPEQCAYGRNIIYRNDMVEVIVINLPKQKETPIHDHGPSIGYAMVLEGNLINTIYRLNQGKIEHESAHLIREEQFFFSTPGLIHKMVNSGSTRTVSIHVYSPPLQNMTIFQE